ncbi:MAG: NADH-quinone oxidoreductase subunit NuoF [Chloroflexi bacterium]|nr:NADH-quinone oxidoreductase subunit NuoF [Chloroflexota bacterium]MCI0579186.1 NADH-quinone oxidoreductase subunit NuoF [Chloroflexota bacterium]MCI0645265.1 NADH-quinone oxidoreductase subunit NuoF [Chloroflexota bacterium]MCI0726769.1 NADH-quinone oxidoreductase subunit NuoF [Chloroflexota bacterium]
MAHVLLRHRDVENIHRYDVYIANGGYEGLKKALSQHTPDEIKEIVKKSNLRGRGGAGFPAGVKWSFIPKGEGPKYVVINADESEAGTFKDRELIESNPHQVIEGALIAAYAIGAQAVYCYFRGEFMHAALPFEEAIKEGYANKAIGDTIFSSQFSCDFYTHYGAGAYICGEETALLESLEGKLGQPRVRPPFPAQAGLYARPTVVNNVETLANVPPIIVNGADWYLGLGTEKSPGPKILCLSGHVSRPGNYEAPLGLTYRELVFGEQYGGGIPGDKKFKALLPSGGSAPIIVENALDSPITYEGLRPHNSLMGSASVIVLDETVDIVWAAMKLVHFFRHESCGKCTPCREGTYWLDQVYHRLVNGHGREADVKLLESIAGQMQGECLCALGDFATSPVLSTIKYFPDEYRAKVGA